MSVSITIIGTNPPCPRCAILGLLVQDVAAEMGIEVAMRHLAFGDADAGAIAQGLGLTAGTAGHVAQRSGLRIDFDRVHDLIDHPPAPQTLCPEAGGIAAKWSPELDAALRPCEEIAASVGILMTPVLVIDGRVVHAGSVPGKEALRELLAKA